jgi:hypothetical protein
MNFDYLTLDRMRQSHPAWRLLCSDHARLVASFLHRVFVKPNLRVISQADLTESLEDELFSLRQQRGRRQLSETRASLSQRSGFG